MHGYGSRWEFWTFRLKLVRYVFLELWTMISQMFFAVDDDPGTFIIFMTSVLAGYGFHYLFLLRMKKCFAGACRLQSVVVHVLLKVYTTIYAPIAWIAWVSGFDRPISDVGKREKEYLSIVWAKWQSCYNKEGEVGWPSNRFRPFIRLATRVSRHLGFAKPRSKQLEFAFICCTLPEKDISIISQR